MCCSISFMEIFLVLPSGIPLRDLISIFYSLCCTQFSVMRHLLLSVLDRYIGGAWPVPWYYQSLGGYEVFSLPGYFPV